MQVNRVLVTGMSGLIGNIVRKELDGKYELTALNRSLVEGVRCVCADISDFNAILPAFEMQDVVVHLSAIARTGASWEEILPANVIGTYNVFEAARRAGVKRVVFASSGATVSGWEREEPYNALVEGRLEAIPQSWNRLTHESHTRPSGLYGCSKVWGEALAFHYADEHGMSMICLRIGGVLREDRPTSKRLYSIWCSQRDIGQMIRKCVEAPDTLRFDTFYVVSNNRLSYRDIEHAREIVGYDPQDSADDWD